MPMHVVSPSEIFGINLASEHGDFPSFPRFFFYIYIYLKCSGRYHFVVFMMNEAEQGHYNFI